MCIHDVAKVMGSMGSWSVTREVCWAAILSGWLGDGIVTRARSGSYLIIRL